MMIRFQMMFWGKIWEFFHPFFSWYHLLMIIFSYFVPASLLETSPTIKVSLISVLLFISTSLVFITVWWTLFSLHIQNRWESFVINWRWDAEEVFCSLRWCEDDQERVAIDDRKSDMEMMNVFHVMLFNDGGWERRTSPVVVFLRWEMMFWMIINRHVMMNNHSMRQSNLKFWSHMTSWEKVLIMPRPELLSLPSFLISKSCNHLKN